ncbi:hypothetical protein [Marinifilum caeruleilacunae]|uniref:Uncharacterized protein n=1 Tax=Marinifilum caeruleilacunae TaxID=2499076 RepID=A0ABX1WUA4_9BACT|nr:hypothetical protein [Marinifilum caeruleilacunae]NOU59667.1 hypothetical protein [Marinifilum caeruleilacunae]
MDEKTIIEKLQDFAKRTNREIFFKEEQYPLPMIRKNVDFIEEFKGKSHFCIYNPQKWILDESVIEKWFEIIEKIRTVLNNKRVYGSRSLR